MPTRSINLTAEQDAFVEEVVEAGEYQNAGHLSVTARDTQPRRGLT